MITGSMELKELFKQGKIPYKAIEKFMAEHRNRIARYESLDRYYKGEHPVLSRRGQEDGRPDNRIVHNYARYIVVMTVGYLLGDKVKYSSEKDMSPLLKRYKKAGMFDADEEIAKDMSVFGRGYELLYLWGGGEGGASAPIPKSYVIDPRNIFVVYGDTPEREKLFAVYYYPRFTTHGERDGYAVNVYTQDKILAFEAKSPYGGQLVPLHEKPHYFRGVPVVEYWNNEEGTGDFEDVLSLIDAYNLLQSDRVNDVERFVQAILFLKNFSLEEEDAGLLRERRILQATGGDDVDAKWLVNALDQEGVEIVRKTIEQDIHKFSFVPAVTDEQFAGNASGVAMKYKLIGLSQMNKIKKRYMERGLRERLRLCSNLPNFSLGIDPEEITVEFTHSLPVNDLETAQMVRNLTNIVSQETLLKQLSFVENPQEEKRKTEKGHIYGDTSQF